MKILFKQFRKSLIKNIFLIFSLSSLLTTLSFVIGASVNLSQTFISSYNRLNHKGNKSDVVSNIPSDFGKLNFSYSLSNNPIKIFQSTLNLQPTNVSNGIKFERIDNTFFPYNRSDFYETSDTGQEILYRNNKMLSLNGNIKPIENNGKLSFEFDNNLKHPIWDINLGLTYKRALNPSPAETAVSFSFVNSEGSILFNPQYLLFNKNGVPFSYLDLGTLKDSVELQLSHAKFNNDTLNKHNNYYDENGIGIVDGVFDRFKKGKDGGIFTNSNDRSWLFSLDNKYFDFWDYNENFVVKSISRFIEPVDVLPYEFKINFDGNSSELKFIKYFAKNNPSLLKEAFKNIFPDLETKNNLNLYNEEVNGNISLVENNGNFSILLALPDSMFSSYTLSGTENNVNIYNINDNKAIVLENFKSYLENKFSSELYKIFMENFYIEMLDEKVNVVKESEYFYHDKETSNSYLIVPKKNNGSNDIVINDGLNLKDDETVIKLKDSINETVNGKLSSNFFIYLKKIIDLIPESEIDAIPGKENAAKTIDGNNYSQFFLFKYCLDYVYDKLIIREDKTIPINLLETKEFKILIKLMSWDSKTSPLLDFNSDKLTISFSFISWLEAIYFEVVVNLPIIDNMFIVINDSFALDNRKKILPTKINEKRLSLWDEKLFQINKLNKSERIPTFINWYNNLLDSSIQDAILSRDETIYIFNKYYFYFNEYLKLLPNEYKMYYENSYLLISGFGLSPDFAYPIISPSSPIPSSKNQAIIYVNNSSFNMMQISESSIFSYLSYKSENIKNKDIIKTINSYSINNLNSKLFNVSFASNATFLSNVWLRVYFPQKINDLIIVFAFIFSLFLILLSMFVITLLTKSLMKSMTEVISVCIANGISLKKILLTNGVNLGILAIITSFLGYIISYFTQSSFIGIFSNVWFIPTAITQFNPIIFIPLMVMSIGILVGTFSYILYKKFKEPVSSILNNKESIKTNKLTNILHFNISKIPTIFKLSLGFGINNIGKLLLLLILGSISLGVITSCVTINSKFNESQLLTKNTNLYNYNYSFRDVNESTGLYKPVPLERIGFEDKEIGITSIYTNSKYPYNDDELYAKQIPYHKGKNSIEINNQNPGKISNIILPSYNVYNDLRSSKDIFLNSSASLFLLKLSIKFASIPINIWDEIKNYFPQWIRSDMEKQTEIFSNKVMDYYGEWYFDFIDLISTYDDAESNVIGSVVDDNNSNKFDLSINSIKHSDAGYYYATFTRNNTKYRTNPFFVWPNSEQWYWDESVTSEDNRFEPKLGEDILIDVKDKDFYSYKNNNQFREKPKNNPIKASEEDDVKFIFIPAYNNERIFGGKDNNKISTSSINPEKLKLSKEFLDFTTVLFSDPKVSIYDSKISFGILPFNRYDKNTNLGDEKITNVNVNATFYDKFLPTKTIRENIDLVGIKENSDLIKLTNSKGKSINNKISYKDGFDVSNDYIKVIVNNGAKLKYKLDYGSIIDIEVKNSSLNNSYNLLNTFVPIKNPLKTRFKLKVVDFSSDSFGTSFYIDQKVANKILGLDEMRFYSSYNPDIKTIKANNDDYDSPRFPFNGIVSNSNDMVISKNSLPFYTNVGIWSFTPKATDIVNVPKLYDKIVTYNEPMLRELAKSIKLNFDNSFNDSPSLPIDTLRNNIVSFFNSNFGISNFISNLELINDTEIFSSSISTVISTNDLDKIFSIISNLSTNLIIGSSSILIPLMLFVSMTSCLSIVYDISKNLNLMYVLGYSKRNILLALLMMLSPALILSILVGIGLLFAINYGIQFAIFNLTSIFIYPYVHVPPLIIGMFVVLLIFIVSITTAWIRLNHSKLETAFKF